MCKFILACFCVAGAALAAPIPKRTEKDPVYFATDVGVKAVYDQGGVEWTETVSDVKKRAGGDGWDITIERVRGKVQPSKETWEVLEDGLYLQVSAEDKQRLPFLKLPHRAGNEWSAAQGFKFVALKPVQVKVPAGEFEAIGVAVYVNKDLFVTRWYAPGVGLIKVEMDSKVTVLKSFSKEKK